MDVRVIIEALKYWSSEVVIEFMKENKAVIATAVTGVVVALLVNVHPAFDGMEPFIEQIVLGIIAAVVSVAWRKEHGRLNVAQEKIETMESSLRSLRRLNPTEENK